MVMGLGSGDWGDDMPFGIDEEIDPNAMYCLICDEKIETYSNEFFRDEDGRKKYGAICKDCKKKKKGSE